MMSKAVYKFYWNCGRMGDVEGIFVEETEYVNQLIGKDVYFGEILGKHSEVYGTLDSGDINLVSNDPTIVKIFEDNKINVGYNPVTYMLQDVEFKDGTYILDDGTEIKEIK
jgi:hypothetical protein